MSGRRQYDSEIYQRSWLLWCEFDSAAQVFNSLRIIVFKVQCQTQVFQRFGKVRIHTYGQGELALGRFDVSSVEKDDTALEVSFWQGLQAECFIERGERLVEPRFFCQLFASLIMNMGFRQQPGFAWCINVGGP